MKKILLAFFSFFIMNISLAQSAAEGDSTKPFSEDHVMLMQYKYEMAKRMAMDSVAHSKEIEIFRAELAMMSTQVKAKSSQVKLLYVVNIGLVSLLLFMWVRKKKKSGN